MRPLQRNRGPRIASVHTKFPWEDEGDFPGGGEPGEPEAEDGGEDEEDDSGGATITDNVAKALAEAWKKLEVDGLGPPGGPGWGGGGGDGDRMPGPPIFSGPSRQVPPGGGLPPGLTRPSESIPEVAVPPKKVNVKCDELAPKISKVLERLRYNCDAARRCNRAGTCPPDAYRHFQTEERVYLTVFTVLHDICLRAGCPNCPPRPEPCDAL